ncbi:4Fe-4S dicluster domain-containing protein [Bacteroidota bacterium]
MKQFHLKKIRWVIAFIFLSATAFLFVDFTRLISPRLLDGILFIQFVPSILNFIQKPVFWASGFILVITLTLFFGRVYCSAFCPLGIMQDIISRLKFRRSKRNVFKFRKEHVWWRYGLLVVTIVFLLFGSLFMIDLLDPYSNFGRMMSNLFRPLYLAGNNLLVTVLEHFDVYALYRVEYKLPNWVALTFPLGFLMLILYMAGFHGRLYCNTICPVGTLLGLGSKVSLFKINIDRSNCTLCGSCSSVCKSNCIDVKQARVDFSRCVACFNCIPSCSEGGIKYLNTMSSFQRAPVRQGNDNLKSDNYTIDSNRRKSLILGGSLLSTLLLKASDQKKKIVTDTAKAGEIPFKKQYPSSPPGSISIAHFTSRCTACHLCVSVCPTQVLQPALLEYGLEGILQPQLDSSVNFCNFDCVLCSEVCPSGAILPLTIDKKHKTQVGRVHFIKESCVVFTDKKDCGSCAEHCPTKAVKMVPFEGDLAIPEVDNEVCVGCHACEYACPTKPYKAIYVEGNPVHLVAKVPESKVEEAAFKPEDDFPF